MAFGPADIPRLSETAVDVPVLGFALFVAILAGALPSLAPAMRALAGVIAQGRLRRLLDDRPQPRWRDPDRVRGGARDDARGRRRLVLKSFARLTAVPPGFNSERILSLKVFLTPPRYRSVASEKQYIGSASLA